MTNRIMGTATAVCCLCLLVSQSSRGQQPATTPPSSAASTTTNPSEQTGKKIGTIVSSAIDTAFPVIGKILDLFKGSNKKSASKDEVTKATNDAQKQFLATVKQKMQPAATVAKELGVLQAFATAAVNAHENIVKINGLLEQNMPDYDQVDTEWGIAKNYLADVITIKKEDIQAVSDPVIKLRLMDLQDSRRDLMIRIDKNVALGKTHKTLKKADLQVQIEAMSALLKGLNSLAAIELAELQADIDSLAKWASGAAGGGEKAISPNSQLLKIADAAIGTAKGAVSSTAVPKE
jgi:hypothetical protein